MQSRQSWSPAKIGVVTFTIALAMVGVYRQFVVVARERLPDPKMVLPLPVVKSGWTFRDLPLGPTERTSKAAINLLGFSDYVYREYRSEGVAFLVYVAYWKPGTPVQLVDAHTPDICWAEAGWICESREENIAFGSEGRGLRNGSMRTFISPSQTKVNVIFWHFVDGKPYNRPPASQVLDYFRWVLSSAYGHCLSPPNQYFVRVSCDKPLRTIEHEAIVADVIGVVGNMVLGAAQRGD